MEKYIPHFLKNKDGQIYIWAKDNSILLLKVIIKQKIPLSVPNLLSLFFLLQTSLFK
jgi:hypothetical protein